MTCISVYNSVNLTAMCMNFHCREAYVDRHECEDVVAYRKEDLKTVNSLHSSATMQ